jgi:hypothetical protein
LELVWVGILLIVVISIGIASWIMVRYGLIASSVFVGVVGAGVTYSIFGRAYMTMGGFVFCLGWFTSFGGWKTIVLDYIRGSTDNASRITKSKKPKKVTVKKDTGT